MKKIIVEFSGWIEVNENTKFSHIETLDTIPASEYLELDEEQRQMYVIENFSVAYEQSNDGEFVDLRLMVEEEKEFDWQEKE